MNNIWIYTIGTVMAVSLLSLVGVLTLSVNKEKLNRIVHYLVSFAVGTLFGGVFIHLLPSLFERTESKAISLLVFVPVGIILFFILEKFVRWRHCHDLDCDEHPQHIVPMNLVGDALHNLIDGIIIGTAFLVSPEVGLATAIAVAFHELPQEIGDFGVLIHGGLPVKKALAFNFISSLTAIAGAVFALILGSTIESFVPVLLPITAGGFIYIAGSDLIPELHHQDDPKKSILQLIYMIAGLAVMYGLHHIFE